MTGNGRGDILERLRQRVRAAHRSALHEVARVEARQDVAPAPRLRPVPLHEIAIELTGKCNLTCEMCSVWKGGRDGPGQDRIRELLAEARALGAQVFTATGAEPFMRKDTVPILAEAARLGYGRISVVTNGTLIARHAERLAAIPGLSLGISIDGPEAVHDALRGAGMYREALAGLHAVRARGVPVTLKGVLMRPTLSTADHLIDLAVDLGLASVSYQPFQPEIAWDQPDHSRWLFGPEDRQAVSATLAALLDKARQAGVRIATEAVFPAILPYLFDGVRPVPPGGCALPARFVLIDGRGETYPCFFMRGQSMGNVMQGVRLRDIWHGPVQRRMQARGRAGDCPGCLAGCSDLASYDAAAGLAQT
ncbi:radical SAM protein [Rhodovulum euryhalinum]|uniref:MoaA/NifB/PqqE/SkfB family radical SAM enzyme n=1 Tax=Rhodovulum euryhalinum TaxID=35805 RepID=A0A4R2KI50_9RHOB|nr:radical SAM protein [Rhodovulum euryhalinum]TCO72047.1 MoaA/NifB/PqqE/SkfB family radical SAM enzyme [Rhodovulum euryhalinum]